MPRNVWKTKNSNVLPTVVLGKKSDKCCQLLYTHYLKDISLSLWCVCVWSFLGAGSKLSPYSLDHKVFCEDHLKPNHHVNESGTSLSKPGLHTEPAMGHDS